MLHIISGKLKNKKLQTPKGLSTRPTSSRLREALFNICQHEIAGARFLDLFAGSGAMGLEALSRGAASAVFVDSDRESTHCIKGNVKLLELSDCARVIMGDAVKLLATLGTFDLIYADPPYFEKNSGVAYSADVLRIIDQSHLLAPGGMLFIEDSKAWEPETEDLHTLRLKSSRRMGRSVLHQFLN